MAKLFVGLAIAVMLAAAVLGFLAKDNIDKLQASLKQTKQILKTTEDKLAKTEAELKATKEELDAAKMKIEMQTTEINGLKKDLDEKKTELAQTKADLDAKTAELTAANDKIAKMNPPGDKPGMSLEDVLKQFEQTKADLTKAQAEAAEKGAMVEALNKQKLDADEKLAVAQKEVKRYQDNVSRNGLTGKILAVNPGWNFVVLSVGDKQGAAPGSTMIVTRGGEAIGKARITSVEPSTSIADLVPGSVRKGVSVQPGDVVIYEGPRNRPIAPAGPGGAPAALAPAPGQ
ncbi:MAG: hypothetical protein QOE70_6554 [Chthoniobacter sp.]|jgi:septal ring factor EnvC (AmiA/AmiB activator)|nr:hypothetical protein [Chthoniobacter sp.]